MAFLRTSGSSTSRGVGRRLAGAALAAAVAAGLLPGCGSDDAPSATAAATAEPATTNEPAPTTSTNEPAAMASPAADDALDAHVAFVLELLSDPEAVTDEQLVEHFAPSFLAVVPAEAVRSETVALTAGIEGPWTEQRRELTPTGAASEVVAADGTRMILVLDLDPAEPHLLVGAQLLPAIDELFAEPGTPTEVDAALADAAARIDYGVYDVGDGECSVLRQTGDGRVFPTASAFKLWVLLAVARSVESGDLTWDDLVAVDPSHRSSPDGEIDELPDGAEVSVRRLAEAMISVSDNTATDHLIALVGRETVERTIAELGVSTADRNTPLLTTRELFVLRVFEPELGDRYLALESVEERRALLDGEVRAAELPWSDSAFGIDEFAAVIDGLSPTLIDDIEWFATADDLCLTLVELDRISQKPGLSAVADILAINPGVPFPPGMWSTVRYKGGSEVGVFTLAYWFEAPDGAQRVAVLALTDPTDPIDETDALTAATRFLALVPTFG